MNPLLAALVQLGIITQQDAERMGRQMDPAALRAYGEQALTQAFANGLSAQRTRLLELLGKVDGRPTPRQIDAFWTKEDEALWTAVQPTIQSIAAEAAVTASVAHNDNTWQLVNENVLSWVDRYYTSSAAAFVGSVPNLNDTSRQQFANVFAEWQRGTLPETGYERGLPQLIKALEPIFGEGRATRIGVTETTRVFSEGTVAAARDDEFVTHLRWMVSEDEAVCDVCGPLAGQVVPKDETFEGGLMPPAHVNCRCWLAEETAGTLAVADAQRENLPQDSPIAPTVSPQRFMEFNDISEAQAWGENGFSEWEKSLSTQERKAFELYQSTEYREINDTLRTGGTLDKQQRSLTKNLDASLARAAIDRDIVAYRGFSSEWYVDNFDRLPGTIITDNAYLSTSVDRAVGKKFADYAIGDGVTPIIAEIRLPTGAKAAYVNTLPSLSESEVLIARGTQYRVISAAVDDEGMRRIIMEAIIGN